jgi:hypothetical protein
MAPAKCAIRTVRAIELLLYIAPVTAAQFAAT